MGKGASKAGCVKFQHLIVALLGWSAGVHCLLLQQLLLPQVACAPPHRPTGWRATSSKANPAHLRLQIMLLCK